MIRVRSLLVLAVAFVLMAAMPIAAQAQAPVADAQRGRRGFGMMAGRGGNLLGLLRREQIQKELKLSEEQVTKVGEVGQKYREEMRPKWTALREIEDREQRRAKMTELTEQSEEKSRNQLREVLAREQMIRLYQIRLQIRGPVYGLNHKFIAGRLKLTPEQREKAAQIQKDSQQKTREAFQGMRGLSQEERRQKMSEVREKLGKIRSDAAEQVLSVLTAQQKEQFEKLKGEKFELQRRRRES